MADDLATRLARAHVAGGWDAVAMLVRTMMEAAALREADDEALSQARWLVRQSQMGAD